MAGGNFPPCSGENMTKALLVKILTAENQWSDEIWLEDTFNFILLGTWNAVVHVQRYFEEESDANSPEIVKIWTDVEAFTAPGAYIGEEPEGAFYRFGIKEGNYTSGQIEGRLSQ